MCVCGMSMREAKPRAHEKRHSRENLYPTHRDICAKPFEWLRVWGAFFFFVMCEIATPQRSSDAFPYLDLEVVSRFVWTRESICSMQAQSRKTLWRTPNVSAICLLNNICINLDYSAQCALVRAYVLWLKSDVQCAFVCQCLAGKESNGTTHTSSSYSRDAPHIFSCSAHKVNECVCLMVISIKRRAHILLFGCSVRNEVDDLPPHFEENRLFEDLCIHVWRNLTAHRTSHMDEHISNIHVGATNCHWLNESKAHIAQRTWNKTHIVFVYRRNIFIFIRILYFDWRKCIWDKVCI